jgi:TonB family protein
MRIQVTQKLAGLYIVAVLGIYGMVGCNNDSDSKTSATATDSSKMAATTDSTMKDTSAMAAKPVKKKRKASVTMESTGTGKIVKDKDGVYSSVEVMPEYTGGQNGLSTYINDHIEYNSAAADDNTMSTVRVSFIVDENGKVKDAHAVGDQKPGYDLSNQAVKVISNMPDWTPGKVHGKSVKTRVVLPIAFQLES